jgi:uncharacterized caspase-like protein
MRAADAIPARIVSHPDGLFKDAARGVVDQIGTQASARQKNVILGFVSGHGASPATSDGRDYACNYDVIAPATQAIQFKEPRTQ